MSNIWSIYKREIQTYFFSPLAYVLYTFFLIISGLFFYMYFAAYVDFSRQAMMQQQFRQMALPNYTETVLLGITNVMTFVMLFIMPLLTMRIFAEEKKMGTIELLFTYPITDLQILLGKYLAAVTVFVGMVIPTLLYIVISSYIVPDQTYIPSVLASYVGVFLIGLAFLSIGIFASSLTENQIVAGVIAFALLLVLWMIGFVDEIQPGTLGQICDRISVYAHFEQFSQGVIDTADISFYILFSLFFLFLTLRVLESHRWRG